jgi:hypothetical protein
MRNYSFLSIYIVVSIILYIGFVTTTDALVGNICTGGMYVYLNDNLCYRFINSLILSLFY